MTQIFATFLLTSGIGTALTFLLMLLRPATRKVFSASWHYYMWLVVLLVMVLPVKISLPEKDSEIPYAFETAAIQENQSGNIQLPVIEETELNKEGQTLPVQSESVSAVKIVKDFVSDNMLLLSIIWLSGATLMFVIKFMAYLMFLIKIHKHSKVIACPQIRAYIKRNIKVRKSNSICSPLILGIVRPVLLLPETCMTPEQLQNVLAHEMTHLKRNDILYKWFVSMVKSVHWFNPAIYFISKQVNIDCEISCDLAVVSKMDERSERGYMETILSLLTTNNTKAISLTTGMAGNKEILKRRFMMIKNKIKFSRKRAVLSAALAVVILVSVILGSGVLNQRVQNVFENSVMTLNTDVADGDGFNALLAGVDNGGRTDMVMLVMVNSDGIKGLSIPRNAVFDGKRISDIFANENGEQVAIDVVKQKLNIPVHYYAQIRLSAIKDIVNSLGGVEFDVPMDMAYDDPHQNLHIDLKKGMQTLDGDAVCQLLQFRRGYAEGDLTRIQLQQQFLKALIQQKLNKEGINKIPGILKAISRNIKTNYSFKNVKQDVKLLAAASEKEVVFSTVPGTIRLQNEMPVYDIEIVEITNGSDEVIKEVIFFETTPGQAIIEKQEDGWYKLPQQVYAVFDYEGKLPYAVMAYFTPAGTEMSDSRRQIAKITTPYTYHTAAQVLSMEINFSDADTLGHLQFVFSYEDGSTAVSQLYNVYRP